MLNILVNILKLGKSIYFTALCKGGRAELRNNHEMAEAWSFFSKQHPHPRRQSKRTSPMLFTRNKVLEQYTLMPYLQFFVWFVIIFQMKRSKIHYCAVWRSALHKSLNSTPFLRLTERCLWVRGLSFKCFEVCTSYIVGYAVVLFPCFSWLAFCNHD